MPGCSRPNSGGHCFAQDARHGMIFDDQVNAQCVCIFHETLIKVLTQNRSAIKTPFRLRAQTIYERSE